MAKKSLVYKHPFFYILGLKFLHKSNFYQRCQYMASFIKEGETVLEPGCGLGLLASFLPKKTKYLGFDTNENFITYGRKKGLNIYYGDVLDRSNYQKTGVVIICDVLHHLKPADRKKFIKHSFSFAKRLVIVCECSQEEENLWGKIIHPIKRLGFELLEKDGTNEPKYDECYTEKQLKKEIENGFRVIPRNIKREVKKFGVDLVATFYIRDDP